MNTMWCMAATCELISYFMHLQCNVSQAVSDSHTVGYHWREHWRSVLMRLGTPSVTAAGITMMLLLCVTNWDIHN